MRFFSLNSLLSGGLTVLLFFGNLLPASAQGKTGARFMKERRIFLWDVTISMVGATSSPGFPEAKPRTNPDYAYNEGIKYYNESGDIFDDTRARLLSLIDDIPDEGCEIIVIPFTNCLQTPLWVKSATPEDKERVKSMVMSWNNLKSAATYTGKCLQKVIDDYFHPEKINRVVLLTDGEPKDKDKLKDIISSWDTGKSETEYYNNKLVYVMLTEDAEKMKDEFDACDNQNKGVTFLSRDENVAEMLTFALMETQHCIHISEYLDKDSSLLEGGNLVLGCRRIAGPDVMMKDIKCTFKGEDASLLSVDETAVSVDDNGNLVIPFCFVESDREAYLDRLRDSGFVGKVSLECAVDSSCKNTFIDGSNKVEIEIVVKPEPRAVISLSTK